MVYNTRMRALVHLFAAAAFAVSALTLAGCATSEQKPLAEVNSALTHGNVKRHLVIGETTSAEVVEIFGAPNITAQDGAGNEVWTYQRAATTAQGEEKKDIWELVLFGGSVSQLSAERSSRMITLIIKFDKAGVVSDFRSRASNF